MDKIKTCTKCKIEKSINDFYSNKSIKNGKRRECIGCYNAWQKQNNATEESKIKRRKYKLYYKYGLTIEDVEELLVIQSNRCALCLKLFTKMFDIDHDHKTGKVRGLLCRDCNIVIGRVEKLSLKFIEKYLEGAI